MILAAGLTPAWQQTMRFPQLRPGEVNRAAEVYWDASGKNLNVGAALAALGAPSHTLSPVGGWSGRAIRENFQQRGLSATWIECAAATRVCTTLLQASSATELVENAAPLSEDELNAFCEAYRSCVADADYVVLTGSLPRGTPATFYRDLLRATRCPAVLDVRGPELLAALEEKPRVVKPNREELQMTTTSPLRDRADVLQAMRNLLAKGAQAVVVTQGKAAVWVVEGNNAWELTPPEAPLVVNPIGCGDCLAAGLAAGLQRGLPLLDAVRLGMAAAADNLPQLLPARLDAVRVERIAARIGCDKIAG
jgi:tagatose 6-phosphate kinase